MTCLFMFAVIVVGADFPICTAADVQEYPCAVYANNQYYVFWVDNRHHLVDSVHSIYGARVSTSGTVVDPDGKLLFSNEVGYATCAAYDGSNLLVVFRDSC